MHTFSSNATLNDASLTPSSRAASGAKGSDASEAAMRSSCSNSFNTTPAGTPPAEGRQASALCTALTAAPLASPRGCWSQSMRPRCRTCARQQQANTLWRRWQEIKIHQVVRFCTSTPHLSHADGHKLGTGCGSSSQTHTHTATGEAGSLTRGPQVLRSVRAVAVVHESCGRCQANCYRYEYSPSRFQPEIPILPSISHL